MNIIRKSGYDNKIALSCLTEQKIVHLEKYVDKHFKHLINDDVYSKMRTFSFVPGHKDTLMKLQNLAKSSIENEETKSEMIDVDQLPVSFLMKELIRTDIQNANKSKNNRRYPDSVKYFATYLYMLCGKSSYEILCNNLPLPVVGSICKFCIKIFIGNQSCLLLNQLVSISFNIIFQFIVLQ